MRQNSEYTESRFYFLMNMDVIYYMRNKVLRHMSVSNYVVFFE